MIEINSTVSISEHELSFTYDRSPGPGGQNVNKVNTRVTLIFDVKKSVSLSNQQKTLIQSKLASRISLDGILRVSSCKERTQLANRRSAINRFVELLSKSFETPAKRKKTKVPAGAKQKRIDDKKQRGAVKRSRQVKLSTKDD